MKLLKFFLKKIICIHFFLEILTHKHYLNCLSKIIYLFNQFWSRSKFISLITETQKAYRPIPSEYNWWGVLGQLLKSFYFLFVAPINFLISFFILLLANKILVTSLSNLHDHHTPPPPKHHLCSIQCLHTTPYPPPPHESL